MKVTFWTGGDGIEVSMILSEELALITKTCCIGGEGIEVLQTREDSKRLKDSDSKTRTDAPLPLLHPLHPLPQIRPPLLVDLGKKDADLGKKVVVDLVNEMDLVSSDFEHTSK